MAVKFMAVKFGGNGGFAVNKTQILRINKNVVTGDGWCAVSSGWLLSLGLYVDWYKKISGHCGCGAHLVY